MTDIQEPVNIDSGSKPTVLSGIPPRDQLAAAVGSECYDCGERITSVSSLILLTSNDGRPASHRTWTDAEHVGCSGEAAYRFREMVIDNPGGVFAWIAGFDPDTVHIEADPVEAARRLSGPSLHIQAGGMLDYDIRWDTVADHYTLAEVNQIRGDGQATFRYR